LPDDSYLDAARQMSDAVTDQDSGVRDSIRARHTAAREVERIMELRPAAGLG